MHPHRMIPSLMHDVLPRDYPPRDLDRRGLDRRGSIVWVAGPEPLGPRGGLRWSVRVMSLRQACGDRTPVYDCGGGTYRTRAAALEAFRELCLR
jgi:hypothetical protein